MRSATLLAVLAAAVLVVPLARSATTPAGYDSHGDAQALYARKRAPIGQNAVPAERYAAAKGQRSRMPVYSTAGRTRGASAFNAYLGSSWANLGPGNIGGRTRALIVDPSTPSTLYAGGVAGGVFKSTDSGATWVAKGDAMANLAVVTLARDPGNANNLLAGTGESFLKSTLDFPYAVRGDGIFRSTNAGGAWTQVASTAGNASFSYVNKIVYSPTNSGYAYAATTNRDTTTGGGVWRTTDGGATWTQILDTSAGTRPGGCLDLVIRNNGGADWVVASCGGIDDQAYIQTNQSANTGTTWTSFTDPSNIGANGPASMGRTTLAIAPSNTLTMYALSAALKAGSLKDGLYKFFNSTDAGVTWAEVPLGVGPGGGTELSDLLLTDPYQATLLTCGRAAANVFKSLGWYDNALAVDPTDSSILWAGGIDLFKSTDGGVTWGLASYASDPSTTGFHTNQHAIVFDPGYDGSADKTLYLANDGGIFKTSDATAAAASYTTGNGLALACDPVNSSLVFSKVSNQGYGVTQFYGGAVAPGGALYFGGTQGNGTVLGPGGGPNAWSTINDGEAGAVAVDPSNPSLLFSEHAGLSIEKCTAGAACDAASWTAAVTGIADAGFLTVAPIAMDPSTPTRLWTGGFSLWRSANSAATWVKASANFGSTTLPVHVTAITVAKSNSNAVMAGTDDGKIYSTTKALTSTAYVLAQPVPGAWLSSVAFDPSDSTIAYATYSTFGVTHVWKSLDGGATWTGLDGTGSTLPDIPAHSIVVDPTDTQRLYVGTDLGVFVSPDAGANWYVENTGFAATVTEVLVTNGPHLYAFTHGRGVFRVGLTNAAQTVAVELAAATTSANEGTTAQVALSVHTSDGAVTAAPIVVQYATKDGTAKSGSDYAQIGSSVTIPAGTADGGSANIPVAILGDVTNEIAETFTLSLTGISGGIWGDRRTGTVTITNQGGPFYQFKLPVITVSESATRLVVSVVRGPVNTASGTVTYTAADGTATAGADYAATSGTLSFAPGAAAATFAITLLPDLTFEGAEQLVLRLSNPSTSLGNPNVAVVNITDNDAAATLQFGASKFAVLESAGTANVLVKRSGLATIAATVDYTMTAGTATAGSDYTSTSGTLSFGVGILTQTIGVPILEDTSAEGAETFSVRLSNPGVGAKLGTVPLTTVSITDNDQAVQWSLPSYVVSEAATQAVLTVKRTGGTTGAVNVDYNVTGGTATGGGADYSFTAGTLSFAQGVASKTLAIPFVADTVHEGEETIVVTLSNPSAGLTILGSPDATVKINDNEPTVLFSSSKYTVTEASLKATITVKRTVDFASTAVVSYSIAPGTAAYGIDYAGATTGSLTFAPAIASRTFGVSLKPDTVDEPNETLNLSLTGVTPGLPTGFGLGTPNTAVVSLTDNDAAGTFQFASATYAVSEAGPVATITVKRSGGTASGASIQYTAAAGTATGGDFTPTTGTLTFGFGELVKTFYVPITDDGTPEAAKTVLLTLSSPSYGVKLGLLTSAKLWIVDDD